MVPGPFSPASRRLAAIAAAAVASVGAAVCALWAVGAPDATRLVSSSSSVRLVTGVCLLLGGVALGAVLSRRPRVAMAAVVPMAVLSGATLLEYLLGAHAPFDLLLGPDGEGRSGARMAPNTAVGLTLAASALAALVPGQSRIWALSIAAMLGALTTALAAGAALGYAFDLTAAFEWAGLTRMALLTALSLIVLGAGIVLATREVGRVASWIELPWLASSAGVGAAGLGLLATHALEVDTPGLSERLAGGLHAAAVVFAVLLAGTVAQARHMRLLSYRLTDANRRQAEQERALRDSERRLQLIIDNVPSAVVVHAADSSIVFSNPTAAAVLGLAREQLLGRRAVDPEWRFLREDGSPMPVDEFPVNRVLATGRALHDFVVGIRPGGGQPVRWALVDAVPAIGEDGRLQQVIVSFVDISERQREKRHLEQLASTDALTGLATRRHLVELADHELARARRSGAPLAVILFDLDRFKAINDRHGHETGDVVLRRVGELLRATLREVDLPARWGGEEFCVLLPDTPAPAAVEIAERLRAAVEGMRIPAPDGGPLPVTASFGVTVSGPEDDALPPLVDAADHAMYRAKRDGRNRVRTAPAATARPAAEPASGDA